MVIYLCNSWVTKNLVHHKEVSVFNPLKAILAKFGYRKVVFVEKFSRDDARRLRENGPREKWDDIARNSPTSGGS